MALGSVAMDAPARRRFARLVLAVLVAATGASAFADGTHRRSEAGVVDRGARGLAASSPPRDPAHTDPTTSAGGPPPGPAGLGRRAGAEGAAQPSALPADQWHGVSPRVRTRFGDRRAGPSAGTRANPSKDAAPGMGAPRYPRDADSGAALAYQYCRYRVQVDPTGAGNYRHSVRLRCGDDPDRTTRLASFRTESLEVSIGFNRTFEVSYRW